MATRQIGKEHAQTQRAGVRADISIRRKIAIEIGFGIAENFCRPESLVSAQCDARVLCCEASLAQAALHCVVVWDRSEGGAQPAAHVGGAVIAGEVNPAS